MTSYREQTLQKLVKTKIEIHEKVTAGEKLPETMIHYTLDADHLVIAAKPLKALEENALITNRANVCVFDNFTAGTLKN